MACLLLVFSWRRAHITYFGTDVCCSYYCPVGCFVMCLVAAGGARRRYDIRVLDRPLHRGRIPLVSTRQDPSKHPQKSLLKVAATVVTAAASELLFVFIRDFWYAVVLVWSGRSACWQNRDSCL
jgi:hypothetical protein